MARVARPYAIGGAAAAVSGATAAIALRIVDPVPLPPGTFGFGVAALGGLELLGVTFALVGAVLVVRVPRNAVGWCMVLIGDGYALGGWTAAITGSALADGPGGAAAAAFAGWLTVLFTTIGGLVFGLGFIFPTGRGQSPAWDAAIRIAAVITPFLMTILFLIRPGPLHLFPTIDNPFGVGPDLRPFFGPQVSRTVAAALGPIVPLLAWSLVSRYRQADAIGRQQLKWFVLALLVTVAGVGAAALGAVVSEEPPEAGLVVFGYAGALVPVAIGIAILRHHLYDIDRIINRTIAYAVVTGTIAALFGILLVSLTSVMTTVAGGETLAVAGSTLVVAALFQPLRRRVQRGVDRRFDRTRYDADATVRTFAARLRDDLDLSAVSSEIVGTARSAVRPTTASIWLRGTPR